ncbi:MAG: hypothetical protein DI540_03100 [Sphingobium sp.]|nr:MAG: hypothetical protein DI540_03100 [Sphingobium sp.]
MRISTATRSRLSARWSPSCAPSWAESRPFPKKFGLSRFRPSPFSWSPFEEAGSSPLPRPTSRQDDTGSGG